MKAYLLLTLSLLTLPATHAVSKPSRGSSKPNAILKIGDPIPPFSLYNQNGKLLTEKDLSRKIIVLNFIFTRCAEPTMCPAATQKMTELQKLIRNNALEKDIHLATISFDPTFDTPPILNQYAQAHKIDSSNYSFLTGDTGTIKNLLHRFGVHTVSQKGTIIHSMKTVIIDKSGTIVYLTPQRDWQPKILLKKIKSFL